MKLIEGELVTLEDVIQKHTPFLNKLAFKYAKQTPKYIMDFEDIKSVGVIGMIKAYDNYDDAYGVKYLTYASKVMEGDMRNETNKSKHLIYFSSKIVQLANKIHMENMHKLPDEEIAKKLGAKIKHVKYARDYLKGSKSMNENIELSDGAITFEDKLGEAQDITSIFVEDFISQLPAKLRTIIEMRMDGKMQTEISEVVGVSQPQVARLLKRVGNYYHEYGEAN